MKSIKIDFHKLMLFLLMTLIFLIVNTTKVNYSGSDPHLALLTSQALIEKGTINIDSYRISVPVKQFSGGSWQYIVNDKTHETFYIFPLGTSILSIPFVFVANCFGLNMIKNEDDSNLQFLITSIICILIFYLLYIIACNFLDKWVSLFLTLFLFLGSSLLSVMGTALWSFSYEIVFILLALKEIIKSEKGNKPKVVLIAIFLALAWVCRPSALALIAVVGTWILIKHKSLIWLFFLGILIILIPFCTFSYFSLGQIIPFYYNPFYWSHSFLGIYYFKVLMNVLFTPMRGLFTFTPILLIVFAGLFNSKLRKNTFYKLLCFHFVIFILMLINKLDWYGGWCFGPRMCTDIIPSLSIMFFMVIKEWMPLSKLKMILISVLLAAGVFIHTIQGMYNLNVHNWNSNPDVSEGLPFLCWNWRFPQFLATESSNILKGEMYNLEQDIAFLISKTPDNATLLYWEPSENMKKYLVTWNKDNTSKTSNEVYNSIQEIKLKQKKEFWFPVSLVDEVKNDSSCIIDYSAKANANQILLKASFKQ